MITVDSEVWLKALRHPMEKVARKHHLPRPLKTQMGT